MLTRVLNASLLSQAFSGEIEAGFVADAAEIIGEGDVFAYGKFLLNRIYSGLHE